MELLAKTLVFLQQLGRKIEEVSGDPRSSAFLRQRLAINVQMGNAACILEAMGDAIDPQTDL